MCSDVSKILKPELLEICRRLGSAKLKDHYYLGGGTGLALQIGHRMVDDLCFYSINHSAALEAVSILKLLKLLFPHQSVRIDLKLSNQLDIFIDNTKVCFITYEYPPLNLLVEGSSIAAALSGLKIAAVQDIALMISLNIVRRPCFEDYIDLYFLLQSGRVDLAYILNHAGQKFASDNKIDFYLKRFLERVRYIPEITNKEETLKRIIAAPLTPQEIEAYLQESVIQYGQNRKTIL